MREVNDLHKYRPDNIFEDKNFIINYNEIDKEIVNETIEKLEENYARISSDLNETVGEKIKIEIQHNIKELHNALGFPEAPDWIRGGLGKDRIIIASPLNPPPGSNFENVINTAVHEFTHFLIHKININIPKWLDEGIASFEAKDNSEKWIVKTVGNGIKNNNIPSFEYLDTKEDFNEFFKRDGYQYSYTIIEFLVSTFGWKKLCDFIEDPSDYYGSFMMEKEKIEMNWKKYLEEKYSIC